MDQKPKMAPFSLRGDADPVLSKVFVSEPEQAQTLSLLYEISHELTSILDREELLRRIAERVKKLVDYQVFTVMLWNENEQVLESVFSLRFEDAIPSRFQMPLNQGITGAAAAEPHAFTAEHERLLNILGSYIAVALENARLFEDARQNQTRLQEDLETAREIQRQLLPSGAREVPGLDLATAYIPARALGGDFYDLLPYGVGRLVIAIGDVSGKGTAAALYGSLAIGILRELVHDREASPAEMLTLCSLRFTMPLRAN
jgi:phosphoserine phosphatase RsbU/P